ncbi:hypothetical protein P9112_005559 [Eukaryota sp. TZLM1-RC]
MARNSEKALSMMNRWVAIKTKEHFLKHKEDYERPENPSSVRSVSACEKWRKQVLAELAQRIVKIQNLALTEQDAMDLNTDINDLLVERGRWESRIKQLGGPDYSMISQRMLQEATYAPSEGKYYFGTAKKYLPKKEEEAAVTKLSTRSELSRIADPFYFGFRDETEELLSIEREAEMPYLS